MLQKKIQFLFILFVTFISCQKKEIIQNKSNETLQGHTFLRVTQNKSGNNLFKPCDAEIETYKFYKDSIYHNMGQESDMITKIQISNNNQKISYKGFNTNTNDYESISIEKIEPFYLKINNELFIDELYKSKIKLIKENNCDDDEITKSIDYSINGRWKINCGEGIASMTVQNKNASLIVLANQIYIEMTETKRYDFEKGIAYKLKEIPEDLGTYGIKLDWKEYINDKPIAYVKVIDENTINFYWYGFYNNKTNKREMTECQFNQDSNNKDLILKKCNE
ncbi:hypothetical protein A0O34_20415 [Chryseobacterium glaciei]|uniref:Lipoprotein n=1 Tax=Chryseobacterium glaciei TaxID=1685010 RepID=A0A172Y0G1_9FLAO|nr:hypothetical protein [Chryseobacterium glaciei]ANF52729.1 hypothetical protein A0O34_20415 [Chryseobacterium glaciei]